MKTLTIVLSALLIFPASALDPEVFRQFGEALQKTIAPTEQDKKEWALEKARLDLALQEAKLRKIQIQNEMRMEQLKRIKASFEEKEEFASKEINCEDIKAEITDLGKKAKQILGKEPEKMEESTRIAAVDLLIKENRMYRLYNQKECE